MYFEVVYYSVIFDIEEIYKISHEKRQLSFLWSRIKLKKNAVSAWPGSTFFDVKQYQVGVPLPSKSVLVGRYECVLVLFVVGAVECVQLSCLINYFHGLVCLLVSSWMDTVLNSFWLVESKKLIFQIWSFTNYDAIQLIAQSKGRKGLNDPCLSLSTATRQFGLFIFVIFMNVQF